MHQDIIDVKAEIDICPACLKNHDKLEIEFRGCCSLECMNCFNYHISSKDVPKSENYENDYILKVKCKGKYSLLWCCAMFYSVAFDPNYTHYYPIHKNMFENVIDGIDVTSTVNKIPDYGYWESKNLCDKWYIYPGTATIIKR